MWQALKNKLVFLILVLTEVMLVSALGYVNAASSEPQLKEPRFSQLSSENGLSQDTINDMLIDSDGFLWLATEAGLNRFDGYTNKQILGHNDEFADDSIYALFEDSNNAIWVSTLSSGIHRIDRKTGHSERLINLTYEDQPDWYQFASHFIEGPPGKIYIALDHNVIEFDLHTEDYRSVFALLDQDVEDAEVIRHIALHQDILFIATSVGLFAKDLQTNTIQSVPHVQEDEVNLNNINTKFILIEGNGFWLGTVEGLYRFPLKELVKAIRTGDVAIRSTQEVAQLNIWKMLRKENSVFYLATDQGMYTYDVQNKQLIHLFRPTDARILLSDDDINKVAITKSGQLWLATRSAGALLWSPRSTLFNNVYASPGKSNGLSHNVVLSFHEQDENHIWVGTNNGLNLYHPASGEFEHYLVHDDDKAVYSQSTIYNIVPAETGFVWLVTGIGIVKFDLSKKQIVTLNLDKESLALLNSELAYDISYVGNNKLLVMTEDRFWQLDESQNELLPLEHLNSNLVASQFYSFMPDINDDRPTILLAMTGELWRYDLETQKTELLHRAEKSQAEYSVAPDHLLLDDLGTLWISYPGHGLYGVDPTTFEQKFFFNTKNLLPTNMVFGLNKDQDGNIWVGSHKGILTFFPSSKQLVNYTVVDGLSTNEFNWGADISLSNGKFLYGSQQGFTSFEPQKLRQESSSANQDIAISDVSLISRSLYLGIGDKRDETIHLRHDDIGLTIRFSNMLFDRAKSVSYRYSLSGSADIEFPPSRNADVTFPSLEPGTYEFSVNSFNVHTGEYTKPSRLFIKVDYPLYGSPLAYSAYGLAVLMLMVIIAARRKRQNDKIATAHSETLRSNNRLSMALLASNSGVWEWQKDTNKLVEPRINDELGFSFPQQGISIDDHINLIHEHDKHQYRTKFNVAAEGKDTGLDVIYRLRDHQGNYQWYRDIGALVADPSSPQATKLVGTYSNLTDTVDAQTQAQLFGEAFQHTKDWVVIYDAQFRAIVTNLALREALGIDEKLDINLQLEKAFHSQSISFKDIWLKMRSLKVNDHWSTETDIIGMNGKRFLVDIGITAVANVQAKNEIERYLVILSDVSEQKEAEAALIKLANYDELTGLPNRTLLLDRVQHAFDRAVRESTIIGLFFIDLDRFKQVNDSLGHEAGDELLKVIGDRLEKTLRKSDTVARLGGDEFVVMIEHVESSDSLIYLANDVINALEKPVTLVNQIVSVSASIGISLFPEDATTPKELLKNADIAMYHAKALGSSNFQFFTLSMNQQVQEKLKLENQVKQAHTQKLFTSFYQPIVNCESGVVEGFEMLMRWPVGKEMIPPDVFIPVAEDIGLIHDMTWHIIQSAIPLMKHFHSNNDAYYLSVNLSAKHFANDMGLDLLINLLKKHHIPVHCIRFEITESALMSDYAKAMEAMLEMKSLGFKIALDDFGTGYSSLKYLKDFPIDVLKIDRSFVQDIGIDKGNEAIILATLRMAESLNMKCIAEGIETEEQVDFFKTAGCASLQGYYYAKPMPEADIKPFLSTYRADSNL